MTSSNSKVATVDKAGKIKAIGAGTAIISVKSADKGLVSKCTVNVNPITTTSNSFISSNNANDYIKVDILGINKLKIYGKRLKRDKDLIISVEEIKTEERIYKDKISISKNGDYSVTIDKSIPVGKYKILTYFYDDIKGGYYAYPTGIELTKEENKLYFKYSSAYEQNVIKYKENEILNSDTVVNIEATKDKKTIKELALKISKGKANDYDKILAIHDWVANNIYYDWDAFTTGKFDPTDAIGTLNAKKSVCQGYAELTTALIRSLNIPCKTVIGYALGSGVEDKNWNEIKVGETNHAWNEAYVNNRWIIIDTTWDSSNRYIKGEYLKGSINNRYYDPTIEMFSIDHRKEYNEQ